MKNMKEGKLKKRLLLCEGCQHNAYVDGSTSQTPDACSLELCVRLHPYELAKTIDAAKRHFPKLSDYKELKGAVSYTHLTLPTTPYV